MLTPAVLVSTLFQRAGGVAQPHSAHPLVQMAPVPFTAFFAKLSPTPAFPRVNRQLGVVGAAAKVGFNREAKGPGG